MVPESTLMLPAKAREWNMSAIDISSSKPKIINTTMASLVPAAIDLGGKGVATQDTHALRRAARLTGIHLTLTPPTTAHLTLTLHKHIIGKLGTIGQTTYLRQRLCMRGRVNSRETERDRERENGGMALPATFSTVKNYTTSVPAASTGLSKT